MTLAEIEFLRKLYKRNHRGCAIYALARCLVKWAFEILVVFPTAVVFSIVVDFFKGVVNHIKEIGYTIYDEGRQFGRDWHTVYRLWTEPPKQESEEGKCVQ